MVFQRDSGDAMRLGKIEIDGLTCPPGRREVINFDDDIKGFGIRVTTNGAKVFLFEYWRDGRTHRMRIGAYGDLTHIQARKMATALRGQVAAGQHPAAEKRAARDAAAVDRVVRKAEAEANTLTLAVLIDQWEAKQLRHRSERYRREATRALRVSLSQLLALPAHMISSTVAQRALDAIPTRGAAKAPGPQPAGKDGSTLPAVRGEAMARRVQDYGHALFAWGKARGLVADNPFAAVVVEGRDRARERWLNDSEIAEIWACCGSLGWPWGPYLRFLLLTLQREAETAGLRWSELDGPLATWTIPGSRTKNGKTHLVHLSEPARAILLAAPRLAGCDLVFTTTGTTPISGFSKAKARLDQAIMAARAQAAPGGTEPLPLVPWRLHDFRRTGVTRLAQIGVRWEVADKVLNHVSGAIRGVAAVYQLHDFLTERATALDAWAAHVLSVADHTPKPANVVDLRPDLAGSKA